MVGIVKLTKQRAATSLPVHLLDERGFGHAVLPDRARIWASAHCFSAEAGSFLLYPDEAGKVAGALVGMGDDDDFSAIFSPAIAGKNLPAGSWHFVTEEPHALHYLAALLGTYHFDRYTQKAPQQATMDKRSIDLFLPEALDVGDIERQAKAIFLARDLINIPANDMGPQTLEQVIRQLAADFSASIDVYEGEALSEKNFPLIHAVGRAGCQAPRLVDLRWGEENAPKVTLVGKGVCFDTGGLDLKGASGMALMKKDMGGAANVIALAMMVMDAGLPVRLRLLIPAVENSVAANAMRPGDIIKSRAGLHVEIGNTDAEGRLILADALSFGGEESPDLMIDMATLTGSARIALGADLPPFYSDDEGLAGEIAYWAQAQHDPLWRMPLWRPYLKNMRTPFADMNNISMVNDSFAGSVTAALFLSRFAQGAKSWAHFDIFGWTPSARPGFPKGGEAQGARALYALLRARYGG